MKRAWITVLFSCLLISCNRGNKIPEGILPNDKMATILFEIGMAEARLENFVFRDTMVDRDSALKVELDIVLQIHKLSPESFRKSYEYYTLHPARFKTVSDSIAAIGERGNERLYGRRRDFINTSTDSMRSGASQTDSIIRKLKRPRMPQTP